jgi:preprotein translocase subunit Sec63
VKVVQAELAVQEALAVETVEDSLVVLVVDSVVETVVHQEALAVETVEDSLQVHVVPTNF